MSRERRQNRRSTTNLHPIIHRDRLPFNRTRTKSVRDRRIRAVADDEVDMSAEGVKRASYDHQEPADASPSPVSISTLGQFARCRDGSPIGHREWQSKKARDLLKLVITRRGRPAQRDWLMEARQNPGLLSNRLSVALSTLRAVHPTVRAGAAVVVLRGVFHAARPSGRLAR
jgi:hypothetical protein